MQYVNNLSVINRFKLRAITTEEIKNICKIMKNKPNKYVKEDRSIPKQLEIFYDKIIKTYKCYEFRSINTHKT